MYLKNLTVLGFKSFPDKTTLNFLPGVSAIVGPNGCGKSNISDAVRWVLGEQSAKALRGGEMADVIFNGTDARKPLGMAEVSLTIGNVDAEHLKAAGVEITYNEVTLTRRVFRDGGSEYFINKTPCRLKDIQQLFMGTGVGRSSYSIMAQGNITQIISSKPEDRRMVFEEAAGITKFRTQKKEATRKLELTDQNLLRVADLVREVRRQIGSLQRQAGKARRYKQIMLQLQHLDTQLARHHFDVLQIEIQERQASLGQFRIEIEMCHEMVFRDEAEIGQLRSLLSELEEQIRLSHQEGHELKGQIDRQEGRIAFNRERRQELESQNAKALNDIAVSEERFQAANEELAGNITQLQTVAQSLQEHRQLLQERKCKVESIEGDLANAQENLRTEQSRAFSTLQQLTRVRNEINTLDLQKQGNVVRMEKLAAERIQLEEESARLASRLDEFSANVELERLNIQSNRGTLEERQMRSRDLQNQLNDVGQKLDRLLREQAEVRSRVAVLDQLQKGYEGISEGTVSALRQAQNILGLLMDRISVPNEYIAAIEAALGPRLQLLVTERAEWAEEILTNIAAQKKGEASIAALDLIQRNGTDHLSEAGRPEDSNHVDAVSEQLPALNGNGPDGLEAPLRPALSVVQCEGFAESILKRLLCRTVIVPDLAAASATWRRFQGDYHVVTLSGELLDRDGIYTGGIRAGANKTAASMLGRKNQIAELQGHLKRIEDQVQEVSRSKGSLQSELTAVQAGLQFVQTELRNQEVAIATRQGELKALVQSQTALKQKLEIVKFEAENLASQEKEGQERRTELAGKISDLESDERQNQGAVAGLQSQIEGLRGERELNYTTLTETKVALAAEEQVCASFQQREQAVRRRLAELQQLLENRRAETSGFMQRRAVCDSEIIESEGAIRQLQHKRDAVNAHSAELGARKRTEEEEISQREELLRGNRRRLMEAQQKSGTLEVELAQKNMAVQNLRQRTLERYQVNLEDVRSECITITIASEGAPKIETLTPEQMTVSGASTDWKSVEEQVSALQKRLDEMGPVNLVAIEEYEETEQRLQFLTTQHDDLVKAKEHLLDVINRINSQTRQMFAETFEKIRENFKGMFTEIFGGGKADLILVDAGDALESGIEIVARPPGKQLQSISLLSGGEQTMTAVALLFSIYQVKPSPFCVLDELDAPLDESNINRFIRVLQRFLKHSQFIIITHNKRTIGMADVLYGVTMQEQGVSRIVSVKFHKTQESTFEEPIQSLIPPAPVPSVEAEEDKMQSTKDTIEMVMAQ